MAFQNGSFATVWEVKPNTNYTDVRISTSRKRKDTGAYEQDFGGYVRMIGEAHQKAGRLREKDRIKLGGVACTNNYDKQKGVTYYNFQCFSFEPAENSATQTTPPKFDASISDDVTDEELPFN